MHVQQHKSIAKRHLAPQSWLMMLSFCGGGIFVAVAASHHQPAPAATTVTTAVRLITGHGVVANDLTTTNVDAAVCATSTQFGEQIAILLSQEGALQAAYEDASNARAAILEGGASASREQALLHAASRAEQAETARAAILAAMRSGFYDLLAAHVHPEGITLLQRMDSNAHRPMPEHFKCLDLSEEAWETLQTALRKSEQGLALTSQEITAIAAANSNPLVQTVAQRIATNGPALETWFAEHAHTAAAGTAGPAQ